MRCIVLFPIARLTGLVALGMLAGALPSFAQQCGGDFAEWKAAMHAEAQQAGVGETGLAALDGARIDPEVLKRDRAQGVFSQNFIQFSDRMISEYRLKQGAANLKKYADVFSRAEQQFGGHVGVNTNTAARCQ